MYKIQIRKTIKKNLAFCACLFLFGCSSLDYNRYIEKNQNLEIDDSVNIKIDYIINPASEGWCFLGLYCKSELNYPYQLHIFLLTNEMNYKNFVVNDVKVIYPDGHQEVLAGKSTSDVEQGASGWKQGFDLFYDDFLNMDYKYQDVKLIVTGSAQTSSKKNNFRLEADIYHVAESRIEAGPRN